MIDTSIEPKIVIDGDTRKITVPDELANIAVSLDNNSETVIIQSPATFDDISFAEKNCKIVYTNAKNQYGEFVVTTKQTSGDYLLISWALDDKFTRYGGTANFAVVFYDDGYRWATRPAPINIVDGISDGDSAVAIDTNTAADLIIKVSEALEELDALKTTMGVLQDALITLEETTSANTESITVMSSSISALATDVEDLARRISILEGNDV